MLGKDPETNVVTLGENEDLFSDRLVAEDLNWIACGSPVTSLSVTAKARYSQREAKRSCIRFPKRRRLLNLKKSSAPLHPARLLFFTTATS